MVAHAEKVRPDDVCFVPEKREELTTEGGLDVIGQLARVQDAAARLQRRGIHVSLFIDPVRAQIEAARETGAHGIEIHTGGYCNAAGEKRAAELRSIVEAAALARGLGLEVHGGHGLDYENVMPVAAIPEFVELNIGHSIIARAVLVGLTQAVREMKQLLGRSRSA
jgi:pyridoxine 5-phosphate synthase